VRVESPVDFGSRAAQIDGGVALRWAVAERGGRVQIVADEWCNTLADVEAFAAAGACDMAQIKTPDVGSLVDSARAVLARRAHGIGAYLGGSCSETEVSARAEPSPPARTCSSPARHGRRRGHHACRQRAAPPARAPQKGRPHRLSEHS
jgi:methylaspartate ammonia-lyase